MPRGTGRGGRRGARPHTPDHRPARFEALDIRRQRSVVRPDRHPLRRLDPGGGPTLTRSTGSTSIARRFGRCSKRSQSSFRCPTSCSSTGSGFRASSSHSDPVVKGDRKCAAIAAASILAKVTRDRQNAGTPCAGSTLRVRPTQGVRNPGSPCGGRQVRLLCGAPALVSAGLSVR